MAVARRGIASGYGPVSSGTTITVTKPTGRIGNHDAVEVVRDMLSEGSLDGIHIFFPDPWHKTRRTV